MTEKNWIKRFGDKACEFIAAKNPAAAILAVYRVCTHFGKISSGDVEEHYRHNRKVWDERSAELEEIGADGKKYLEYQRRLGENEGRKPLYFGVRARRKSPYYANYNSCEAIAVYNLQLFFDRENASTFPEWVRRFEADGVALGGLMGSSVASIKRQIKGLGLEYDSLVGKSYKEADLENFGRNNSAFIVNLINNRATIKSGIHTMCITTEETAEGRFYMIHNDYATYGKRRYASLRETIEAYNQGRGAVIELLGVRKALPVGAEGE